MSGQRTEAEKKKLTYLIILIAAAVILVVAVIILVSHFVDESRSKELNKELAEAHQTSIVTQIVTTAPPVTETETETTTEPPPLVTLANMESMIEKNPDTAGWVIIDGTSIDNVVVQCADNDYYLDHDFYGKNSKGGTVFADFRNVVNDYNNKQSDNIIIYGHNQADGTQFGTLKKYKIKPASGSVSNFDFYTSHPTFYFSNLYEEYTYKIIATFVIEVEERHTRDGIIFDYHNFIRFTKKEPYNYKNFIDNVMERSAIDTGVDVNKNDKFITLSTCSNEFEPSRLVVIGRRLRDGESPEVDTTKATINYSAKEPDYNFIYNR